MTFSLRELREGKHLSRQDFHNALLVGSGLAISISTMWLVENDREITRSLAEKFIEALNSTFSLQLQLEDVDWKIRQNKKRGAYFRNDGPQQIHEPKPVILERSWKDTGRRIAQELGIDIASQGYQEAEEHITLYWKSIGTLKK